MATKPLYICTKKKMCKKIYNAAPLPFMGQKRRFIKDFKNVLKQIDDITTIVDLFGGSGILSHVAKCERPDLRVVYNDYDFYCKRLDNVAVTNEILSVVRSLVANVPKGKKIPNEIRYCILDLVRQYEIAGFVDYITLSSSLLFSGKYATNYDELSKHTMYNVMRRADYDVDGYLDGLEIAHCDYRELFPRFPNKEKTLFLIDPPYLSTEVGSYLCYWKLSDYLDVLKLLQGTRFIYFTSSKSQIVELCNWLSENGDLCKILKGTALFTQENVINYNAGFTDMMLVKV